MFQFVNCRLCVPGQGLVSGRDVLVDPSGKIADPRSLFYAAAPSSSSAGSPASSPTVIDCENLILCPGFIDLQLNGCFGVDFSDENVTEEDVLRVSSQLLSQGVTSYCPTLVSLSSSQYRSIIPKFQRLASMVANPSSPIPPHANLLGLHLEGPFFALDKRGAHNPENIISPTKGLESFHEVYGTQDVPLGSPLGVRIVTLAPELPGCLPLISALTSSSDVTVSMGHSQATFEEGQAAVNAGAKLITHLYNAMPSFHHRAPSLIGLLSTPPYSSSSSSSSSDTPSSVRRPHYSIIADGVHCHPSAVSMSYSAHPTGTVLVTDAIAAMGLPDGVHRLGPMLVRKSGRSATLLRRSSSGGKDEDEETEDTTTLAGSVASMDVCVRNFKAFTGCTVGEAVMVASENPARLLGIESCKGVLDIGADGDFVLLDDDMHVVRTYLKGRIVYDAAVTGKREKEPESETRGDTTWNMRLATASCDGQPLTKKGRAQESA